MKYGNGMVVVGKVWREPYPGMITSPPRLPVTYVLLNTESTLVKVVCKLENCLMQTPLFPLCSHERQMLNSIYTEKLPLLLAFWAELSMKGPRFDSFGQTLSYLFVLGKTVFLP